MKRPLIKLFKMTVSAEKTIVAITSAVIPVIIFASVIMRYILHRNFDGLTELVTILVAWLYFLGSAIVTSENTHISASLIDSYVKKKRTFYIVQVIRQTITIVLYCVMFKLSMDTVLWMFQFNPKTAMLRLPQVIVYIPILLCFFMSIVYTTIHIVNFAKEAMNCSATDLLEFDDQGHPKAKGAEI